MKTKIMSSKSDKFKIFRKEFMFKVSLSRFNKKANYIKWATFA